ncbi:MAG TPA: stimulus-sensing domain-containing protein [Caulobacteraceae bacterium]|nr:stimulus-sensing domain-containing protein [Caulobacteraceae bacterium]
MRQRAGAGREGGARTRLRWRPGSRLGRLIVGLNLLGLIILVVGALVLNEFRRSLVEARQDSLRVQGELIANVIAVGATQGSPEPMLEQQRATDLLQALFIPRSQRARLFDAHGRLIADSYLIADRVEERPLAPARKHGEWRLTLFDRPDQPSPKAQDTARTALEKEVDQALQGERISDIRVNASGEQVVSVSLPIQNVKAVLGVLTLEAGDIDATIAAQRLAILPFVLVAFGATLISSLLLSRLIAAPVLRLASAADRVRLSRARSISLPEISRRHDEIGDLARSLESMTDTLSERMDAIERFAADVAHEIRNPLTSIRSAADTLPLVADPAARERLLGILYQDVARLDRLVTDISNASRLDAELSREQPQPFDLEPLLKDITALYSQTTRGGAAVRYIEPDPLAPMLVVGQAGPLGQVFRNLIDNARSFSQPDGEVRVRLWRGLREVLVAVEDDGPGIPEENLETVFQRFYTSRPKGAAFGSNSGLGLSIARQIVTAYRGRIWAENRKDVDGTTLGARFVVSLPEAPPEGRP